MRLIDCLQILQQFFDVTTGAGSILTGVNNNPTHNTYSTRRCGKSKQPA
jgi:hypothetical protein